MQFEKIIKNSDTKYLNFYTAKYNNNGKPFEYYFASRRKEKDIGKSTYVDAVKIVPYIKETD